jgi:hypothetical protein
MSEKAALFIQSELQDTRQAPAIPLGALIIMQSYLLMPYFMQSC